MASKIFTSDYDLDSAIAQANDFIQTLDVSEYVVYGVKLRERVFITSPCWRYSLKVKYRKRDRTSSILPRRIDGIAFCSDKDIVLLILDTISEGNAVDMSITTCRSFFSDPEVCGVVLYDDPN